MPHVLELAPISVECTSCHRAIMLKCEGLHGVAGYPIYNQFNCPHCRKQMAARTPGHIVSIEAA